MELFILNNAMIHLKHHIKQGFMKQAIWMDYIYKNKARKTMHTIVQQLK